MREIPMASSPSSSSSAFTGKLKSPDTPLFRSILKTKWKKTISPTSDVISPVRSILKAKSKQTKSPTSDVKTHSHLRTKQVMLLDWWLTKVKVQVPNPLFKLGVAGLSKKELRVAGNASHGRSVAYFSSSEIVKRHIGGTLETADGITIILVGSINMSRTHENGFPSQVCSHFAIGFPFDWEHIGAQYFGGESIDRGRLSDVTSMSNGNANSRPAPSFKDLPVTRYFDHMMLSSGDYNECTQIKTLFDDILSEYGSCIELNDKDNHQIITDDPLPTECGASLIACKENNRPVVAKSFPLHKAPVDCLTNKDVSNSFDAMPMATDDDVHRLSECVFTRPKTRSEASRNNLVEGLSSNTSMPRTSTKKHSCGINKTDASNVIQSAIQNADSNEVGGILDSSRVRNSRGSGVLTRSRARLVRQIIDPEHNVVEPEVPADQPSINKYVQSEKISDIPTFKEAKKSGKDQFTIDGDVHRLSECRRSKNRLEAARNNQIEGLASNTSIPRISAKKHRGEINKTDASNAIQSSTQNADGIDIGENLNSPRVKNSIKRKFQGSDGTTKEVPASKFSISNQEHNFSPATLNPGLTVIIPASEVAKNQSRVNITNTISPVTGKLSQMDTEIGTRHKYTSSKTGTPNCSRGVLTRSRARLVRQRTDPDHIVVEPQVPTKQPSANKGVQSEKISDMIPTSEAAKKSGKDAPSRRVTRQLLRKRS